MQVMLPSQACGHGKATASGGGWGANVSVLKVARLGERLSGICERGDARFRECAG